MAAKPPHVFFVLTDDNGWAGVGYNNPFIQTPTLDALASDGLTLTSQYVYQFCAPTRGSFLTGRLPYRLASTKKNFIPWHMPDGTHLSYTMLPAKLKVANYTTVHIGKVHTCTFSMQHATLHPVNFTLHMQMRMHCTCTLHTHMRACAVAPRLVRA